MNTTTPKETMERIMAEARDIPHDQGCEVSRFGNIDGLGKCSCFMYPVAAFIRQSCLDYATACVGENENPECTEKEVALWAFRQGENAAKDEIRANIASVGEEVKTIKEE